MEKKLPIIKEIISYIVIIVIVILIKKYVVSPVRVNGASMYPTLNDKDVMILNKISYRFNDIKRFDIVVIDYEDEYLIKRVIGLPGEKLRYSNNQLYINDKKVEENFSKTDIVNFEVRNEPNNQIPKDHYFVIGDNRDISKDSRIIGFIPKDKIVGKSNFTLFPFNKFGNKK